jgi:hypothetical protein
MSSSAGKPSSDLSGKAPSSPGKIVIGSEEKKTESAPLKNDQKLLPEVKPADISAQKPA